MGGCFKGGGGGGGGWNPLTNYMVFLQRGVDTPMYTMMA